MASGTPFYLDTTFWVAGSFVVFVGGVIWAKAHKSIASMLDARSDAIRKQIDEAQSLRDEAEKLLADYQRKQRDAEADAKAIIAQAEADAKLMTEAAKADIETMIKRRERVAADKLAQAKANAVKEVQEAAVEVAVAAATDVLQSSLSGRGGKGKELIEEAISEIPAKLN